MGDGSSSQASTSEIEARIIFESPRTQPAPSDRRRYRRPWNGGGGGAKQTEGPTNLDGVEACCHHLTRNDGDSRDTGTNLLRSWASPASGDGSGGRSWTVRARALADLNTAFTSLATARGCRSQEPPCTPPRSTNIHLQGRCRTGSRRPRCNGGIRKGILR